MSSFAKVAATKSGNTNVASANTCVIVKCGDVRDILFHIP